MIRGAPPRTKGGWDTGGGRALTPALAAAEGRVRGGSASKRGINPRTLSSPNRVHPSAYRPGSPAAMSASSPSIARRVGQSANTGGRKHTPPIPNTFENASFASSASTSSNAFSGGGTSLMRTRAHADVGGKQPMHPMGGALVPQRKENRPFGAGSNVAVRPPPTFTSVSDVVGEPLAQRTGGGAPLPLETLLYHLMHVSQNIADEIRREAQELQAQHAFHGNAIAGGFSEGDVDAIVSKVEEYFKAKIEEYASLLEDEHKIIQSLRTKLHQYTEHNEALERRCAELESALASNRNPSAPEKDSSPTKRDASSTRDGEAEHAPLEHEKESARVAALLEALRAEKRERLRSEEQAQEIIARQDRVIAFLELKVRNGGGVTSITAAGTRHTWADGIYLRPATGPAGTAAPTHALAEEKERNEEGGVLDEENEDDDASGRCLTLSRGPSGSVPPPHAHTKRGVGAHAALFEDTLPQPPSSRPSSVETPSHTGRSAAPTRSAARSTAWTVLECFLAEVESELDSIRASEGKRAEKMEEQRRAREESTGSLSRSSKSSGSARSSRLHPRTSSSSSSWGETQLGGDKQVAVPNARHVPQYASAMSSASTSISSSRGSITRASASPALDTAAPAHHVSTASSEDAHGMGVGSYPYVPPHLYHSHNKAPSLMASSDEEAEAKEPRHDTDE